jgi:alkyl sulfatase BDS1-like metallo-beta-lactamase superfamily hydrolase
MNFSHLKIILVALVLSGACGMAEATAQSKDAEPATRAANDALLNSLPFNDRADFEDAKRGHVAPLPDEIISGEGGKLVWDIRPYGFLQTDHAPATVNPSLWRQAQLNSINGLFKVVDRVYQIRGLDLANLTIIEGDSGLILIDPLTSMETAKAALALYYANRPQKPIVAVIYTHSHVDHFGGSRGVVTPELVLKDHFQIVAPDGFVEHAVSENVIAGTAMRRRAQYQFGGPLPISERAQIDTGLGKAISRGQISLVPPNSLIKKSYETRNIDGVEIEFHLVPGSEAPSEMLLYFPQFKMLNMAEDATHTMHNLYALRGAEVRDARLWSHYIGEAISNYRNRTDVLIAQHHWPMWGSDRIAAFLKKQRDLYKFIHDQSVRLLNRGFTASEIAEQLRLPKSLANDWSTRGYYGTLSHNAKSVYQFYLGWYDGNPADLNPLSRADEAKKQVEYMGGAEKTIERARSDFKNGQYRWVASVMNKVVFADPTNKAARELEADALEQLGYQAEAATWRNEYLVGAQELRNGAVKLPSTPVNEDLLKGVSLDLAFDALGTRLNAGKAEGQHIVVNWVFKDVGDNYVTNLENSALTYTSGSPSVEADASVELTRSAFNKLMGKGARANLPDIPDLAISGNPSKLAQLLGMFDEFLPSFEIVEPPKDGAN